MVNPVTVEVTRGGIVESRHRGALAIVDSHGRLVAGLGDIEVPVFPRSAIKAFQALPLVENGAADAFGFTPAEIALACASHGGEPAHVETARGMLAKLGLDESALECGAHWPTWPKAARDLAHEGLEPGALHNNCSGKHAGMLAVARHAGVAHRGYVRRDHAVQRGIADVIADMCGAATLSAPCGTDGCSVPTWALPLGALARGFARLASGEGLSPARAEAARRIVEAVRGNPFMVAGTRRFCTRLMEAVPRAFVKTGAEGVFCGAVPHAGLGLAVKCDDGASRAAEVTTAAALASLPVWSDGERRVLESFAAVELRNWNEIHVGDIRLSEEAAALLKAAAGAPSDQA
ncbi:asparaginase [Kaustia mangrovi]|uniref:Asparaginase n=1 Tax=Kaustia mangrovi TaxID=2593653 RepID=A0A7S8C288_9HYPH|nr:asparaginase [Kaustia mangrovi]QPC42033.1 asparaginase [Kaustia mangrovi]